ncbi:MAG TPA: hypothetical protein VMB22_01950 [Verrucomicrobiae bacterium]|nr:hypothetical protein [Verrucomicrobiae bacterium]
MDKKRIQLDRSKLFGFKLAQADQKIADKNSPGKLGAKLGVKLGAKPGTKPT